MRPRLVPIVAAVLLVFATSAGAQTGFVADTTWIVEIDGSPAEAEVYRAQSPAAMLVMSDELPEPVMLMLGGGSVNGVQLMKVARQEDGSVSVLANPFTRSFGSYQVEGAGVTFSVDAHNVAILPKPPLVGFHPGTVLLEYDNGYLTRRDAYTPDQALVSQLSSASPATVRVFFGSWCPACGQLVPRILAVEEALGDAPVTFEYYGLPRAFDGDPETERYDVHQVPTAVILRDGSQVGKLVGNELSQPEAALAQTLGG